MEDILGYYFERPDYCGVQPIYNGLINSTYKVNLGVNQFILQEINTSIFKAPEVIVSNTLQIGNYLRNNNYPKNVIEVVPNLNGNYMTFLNGSTWRLTRYIPETICLDKVESNIQAFEAAKAISEFHSYLINFPMFNIKPSIEGFLDYQKRVVDYQIALQNAASNRLEIVKEQIEIVKENLYLIEEYLTINFPSRIVHADAKISNFLFDENNPNQVKAIIDWDTILPGNILCDFGDMVRTYSNLKAEDDPNPNNNFSAENYEALKEGFLFHLREHLTIEEINAMDLTALVVILVQAIRFLTDYLNGNIYYQTDYENHNLDRAINQLNLLKAIKEEICIN